MRRSIFACALAVVLGASSAARAQPTSEPTSSMPPSTPSSPPPADDPEFAVTVAGVSALGVLRGRSEWNRELESEGYVPLDALAGEVGGRAAVQIHGLELAVVPSYTLTRSDEVGRRSVTVQSIFGDVAYDLHHSPSFTLAPSFGLGWQHASACFYDEADANAPEPQGSPIQQIMRAPGRESCLDVDSASLRLGFAMGIVMAGDGGLLFATLRPTFTVPFASSQYSLHGHDVPSFAGPDAPHVSFAVNFEVGFGVGFGRRRW